MPKKTSLKLNQNRGAQRRKSLMSLAVAASLSLAAGCSSNGSTGTDLDMGMGGGGGDGGTGGGGGDMAGTGGGGGSHSVTVVLDSTAGTGSVVSQTGGISCGVGSMVCSGTFSDGTSAVLTASGSGGSTFTGWSGACAGQGAVCTLVISGDVTTTAKFGKQACSVDSVCWEAPLPFGYDLNSVAAISASDVWAVGNAGTTVHYNGKTWTNVPSPTTANLVDVWASRTTGDVWATAGAGAVLHYTNNAWVKVPTSTFTDVPVAIWATDTKVIVPTSQEFVLVYDIPSKVWSRISVTDRPDSALSAVTGTSNSDIWLFSADNNIVHSTNGGASWSRAVPDRSGMPNYNGTSGAFSVGPSDIWEVTSSGYASHSTNPGGTNFGFSNPTVADKLAQSARGLWGTSSTSLFTNGPNVTMYRFDGSKWNPYPTAIQDISSLGRISGTTNTDVWTVGGRGVIVHFDGTAATVNRGNIFNGTSVLSGTKVTSVWASGPTDAWFTTAGATVVHYDGASFTESAKLIPGGGASLKAIWGTSPTDIWAGGNDSAKAVMLHWNGSAWSTVTQPIGFAGVAYAVDAVYASSANVAYAAGAPGTGVEKWDGTSWAVDQGLNKPKQPITKLWGSGDTNVYAIEDTTTNLWLWNGATWSIDTRITDTLTAIGGSSATNAWAGANMGVYHFNGSTWGTKITIPNASGNIVSVSSSSATDAWAIDSSSYTFHTTDGGTTWKQIDTGITKGLNLPLKAFSVSASLNWLAGQAGILSYRK